MDGVRIARAKPSDLLELSKLTMEGFAYTQPAPWKVQDRLLNPKVHYFTAKLGDKLIGFSDLEVDPSNPKLARLLGVYVKEAYRGKGIATQLMEAGLKEANRLGVTRVELLVAEGNEKARSIYESMGFTEGGKLGHPINGKPALKMLKELKA